MFFVFSHAGERMFVTAVAVRFRQQQVKLLTDKADLVTISIPDLSDENREELVEGVDELISHCQARLGRLQETREQLKAVLFGGAS